MSRTRREIQRPLLVAMPRRVWRRRTKGWRMPAGAVYVGRPTKWGNPFTSAKAIECGYVEMEGDRCRRFLVECFRQWLVRDELDSHPWWKWPADDAARQKILDSLPDLRGKDLCCWCGPGRPCHADVLLELANQIPNPKS